MAKSNKSTALLRIRKAIQSRSKTLDLKKLELTSLPPEMAQLKHLEVLNLGNNLLKTIPPEIGNLKNLRVLEIGNNPLITLPAEIGQLKNLNILSIGHCNFTYELGKDIK